MVLTRSEISTSYFSRMTNCSCNGGILASVFARSPCRSSNSAILALKWSRLSGGVRINFEFFSINECNSASLLVAISLSTLVKPFCHSLQWLRMENLSVEESSRTNWMLTVVSSFWTLLATSVYLQSTIAGLLHPMTRFQLR